jgi:tRNA dimethylallyltransferase
MNQGVIFIAGPTASGKSGAALALAELLAGQPMGGFGGGFGGGLQGGVIINADSMQIYRELEVISARPPREDMDRVPHRLYGVLSGAERCSAGRWRTMALAEIEAAHQAGRWPIVVGGTGLYFKVLLEGIADVPDIAPEVLDEVQRRHDALGPERFRAELAQVDPQAAARIELGDQQRLVRAAGVHAATSRSLTSWQSDQPKDGGLGLPVAKFVLAPERHVIYERCNERFGKMLDSGGLAEIENLQTLGFDPDLPVMKAVGVPELMQHLRGEIDLETAVSLAQQATRRYAKRQLTWIRNQMSDWEIVSDFDSQQHSERFLEKIFSFIRNFALTDKP